MNEGAYRPTNKLRWAEWYVDEDRPVYPDRMGSPTMRFRDKRSELQQAWENTKTGEIQWRAIPVEAIDD